MSQSSLMFTITQFLGWVLAWTFKTMKGRKPFLKVKNWISFSARQGYTLLSHSFVLEKAEDKDNPNYDRMVRSIWFQKTWK